MRSRRTEEFFPWNFCPDSLTRERICLQCVKFLNEEEEPIIRTAVTYLITGKLTDDEFDRIKAYCINCGFQGNGYDKAGNAGNRV